VHRVGDLSPSQRTEIRRVLSAKTCAHMKAILAEVMKTGTGRDVKVEGVTLAGKTGTTQKLDRHGTRYGYISTFAGFAPVEDPKAVIVVVVDEPQGAYYGSAVAAPVFAGIVKRGLGYLK
jgi:cell division protein FtsI/penicillin-binding protein 2